MSGLGTALRDLADRQQPVIGPEPADLWARGRRRVVRGRALAAAGVAALVLVVGGIGVTGPEPSFVSPASKPHAPGIPDRVEDPPGWLPAAEYGTRVGPLSVLARGMRHGRMELFGIDAKSGRYRFLANGDAQVPDTPVALSPNGRYVAYWAGPDGRTVSGLTVLDTVTGTEEGLSGGDSTFGLVPGQLTWLNDEILVLQFDEKTHADDQTLGPKATVETFRTDGQGPRVHADVLAGAWSRGRDGSLIARETSNLARPGTNSYRVYDSRLEDREVFTLPAGEFTAVTTSGSLVVAAGALDGAPLVGGLLVGRPDDINKVRSMREVGDLHVGTLLGWTSPTTVLVTGWQGDPEGQASMFTADVVSGKVRRVGNAGDDVDVVLAVASDLAEKPFVAADPPRGVDPMLVRVGGVTALVLAGAGFLLWRRRAQG